jgi:hypothetical protein
MRQTWDGELPAAGPAKETRRSTPVGRAYKEDKHRGVIWEVQRLTAMCNPTTGPVEVASVCWLVRSSREGGAGELLRGCVVLSKKQDRELVLKREGRGAEGKREREWRRRCRGKPEVALDLGLQGGWF